MTGAAAVKLRIEGMTCGSCVARVERALESVAGVAAARVNLTTETATVETGDGAVTSRDLIEAVRAAGYDAESYRADQAASTGLECTQSARLVQHRQALVVAIGLAVPIIGLQWAGPKLGSSPDSAFWWRAMQALLCAMLLRSPAGAPILVGGLRAILHRSPNMDLLISLGVAIAFVGSLASFLVPDLRAFHFHAAAMVLAFINVGRYLEARAKRDASGAISALVRRMPSTATRVTPDGLEEVPVDRIAVKDKVRVAEDVVVPVDGIVVDGEAAMDESAVTGESVPRHRRGGDPVRAGTIVREGLITVEATHVGSASTIGRIIRAVEEAQSQKTRMQRIADRVGGVFVPVVIGMAVVTFAAWVLAYEDLAAWLIQAGVETSRVAQAARAAIAVLVIACPCAMGLATPTAVLVSTGAAALRGILIRDAAALERAAGVQIVLFDKTGTLTTGKPVVEEVVVWPHDSDRSAADRVIQFAASAEQYSQHPFARALVAKAQELGAALLDPDSFNSRPGAGVRADIDGHTVLAGSVSFADDSGIQLDDAEADLRRLTASGRSVVVVAIDGQLAGVVALADGIKPGAKSAVARLSELGIKAVMVTGDHRTTAKAVASAVGIDEVYAQMSPEAKVDVIRRHRDAGQGVAFVGDGINDGPSLAVADVGVTFASATDVAIGAADVTILHDDLRRIPECVALARRSVRIIKQNLFWAFFYNIVAVPLAATGHVPPGAAAGAMMFSSISVVLNSLRLRHVETS